VAVPLDWNRWVWGLLLGLAAAPLGLLAGYDPGHAVFLAFSVGFALIAFTNLAAGVAVFTFVSFLGLEPFGLFDFAARMVLIVAWVALIATRSRHGLEFLTQHPIPAGLLGLFLGWAALSPAWAEDPGEAVHFAEQWALCAALFLVVVSAIQTRADLRLILLAFVLGALTAALLGIVNPASGPDAAGARLSSDLLDPNVLAAALLASAALAIGLFVAIRSPLGRVALLGGAGFCLIAIWLTGSRGALVAGMVVLLAAVFLADQWRPQALVAAVLLVIITYGFFMAFADPQLRDRVTSPTQGQERIQEGRTTLWQVAWRAFEENPVTGLGAGNFRVSSRHFLLQPGVLDRSEEIIEKPAVVHNAYLEVLAELGLVGLSLLLAFLIFCIACFVRAARAFKAVGDHSAQVLAICTALALIGTICANFFFSDEYSKQIWILLALGPATLAIARTSHTADSPV
jgi:O-antigen ligase